MNATIETADLYVPSFVVITLVGPEEYAVSNEASGRHFHANRPTVEFIEALRTSGSFAEATSKTRMPEQTAQALLEQLKRFGVAVQRGHTNTETANPAIPLESRAISIRFDLVDAAPIARRLAGLGRFAFSSTGFVLWLLLGAWAASAFLVNQDKAALALGQVRNTGVGGILAFVVLLVGLKAVHEMGHALAYQEMCRRAGLKAGPIRMGISLFALTPFPFTDVTGAWRLRGRKSRALIGAGGLYLEFTLVFLGTILWANTGAGPLQTAIFQVAMFSAISSLLFNLNPAIKLDGYYILSDLLNFPNLAGRASQAAQAWFGRCLGADVGRPKPWLLVYWALSYLYRWVIFAGIFWLAYQFDPRFAVPVAGIIVAMLIIRPMMQSARQAMKKSARRGRMAAVGAVLALFIGVCLVPFQDRVLLDGHLDRFETQFVRVPEPSRLTLGAGGIPSLHSMDLDHEARDLALRREMIENANRAVTQLQTGAERARLQADLAQISEMQANLATRAQTLTIATADDDIWSPFTAEDLQDSWVNPGKGVLGAVSTPISPVLVLWIDQSDFEVGLLTQGDGTVRVRLHNDPTCEFTTSLNRSDDQVLLQDGALRVRAKINGTLPACARNVPSGAAVVARHPARAKSVVERLWMTVQRSLQDRLPVELLLQNEQET
ncbi:MAG: hypothetical protein AAFY75_01710 [Pseudomonadota bacterium]